VARYGPFVMSTREEILEAIADFRHGKMGSIAPEIARQ
jgi:redox-sensitive bicupin YhaK (pirin superfamily)